ncbi:hypothetical protein GCM10027046_31740 [Uliginosibacterium flavum]
MRAAGAAAGVAGAGAVVLMLSLFLLVLPDADLGLGVLLKEMAMLLAVMMGSGIQAAGCEARSGFRQVRL